MTDDIVDQDQCTHFSAGVAPPAAGDVRSQLLHLLDRYRGARVLDAAAHHALRALVEQLVSPPSLQSLDRSDPDRRRPRWSPTSSSLLDVGPEPVPMPMSRPWPTGRRRQTPTDQDQRSRYRILGLLGTGGFGRVYRAQYVGPRGFQRTCALKVLLCGNASDETVARLRDEARLLGRLEHPGVPKVYRMALVQGGWAIEMEHVAGVDLERVQRSGLALSYRGLLEAFAAVAETLAYVHDARDEHGRPLHLVHRDLKPSNVMLTARGEVKVLDFGIARAEFEAREGRTATHMVMGTPYFMAPERFNGEAGPASDVYAVAAALFGLLARQDFGRARQERQAHDQRVVEALQQLAPHLPDGATPLLNLLYAMMRFEPEDRPSAAEVGQHLRRLAAGAAGPPLSAWAAELVPPLAAQRESQMDQTEVGRELVEASRDDERACSSALPVALPLPALPRVAPPELPSRAWSQAPGPAGPATMSPAIALEVGQGAPITNTSAPQPAGVSTGQPVLLLMAASTTIAIVLAGLLVFRLMGLLR